MAVPKMKRAHKMHRQVGIWVVRFSLERVRGGPRLVHGAGINALMWGRDQTTKLEYMFEPNFMNE